MYVAGVVMVVAGLICGLVAAWYWFKSTRVAFEPGYEDLPHDVLESDFNWALMKAIMLAAHKTARLNKSAAIWTAASVVFGGVGNVLTALAM